MTHVNRKETSTFKNIYRTTFIVSAGYQLRQIVLHTKCRKLHRTNQMAIFNNLKTKQVDRTFNK